MSNKEMQRKIKGEKNKMSTSSRPINFFFVNPDSFVQSKRITWPVRPSCLQLSLV